MLGRLSFDLTLSSLRLHSAMQIDADEILVLEMMLLLL
jgi:hypothetical protein